MKAVGVGRAAAVPGIPGELATDVVIAGLSPTAAALAYGLGVSTLDGLKTSILSVSARDAVVLVDSLARDDVLDAEFSRGR